MLTVLFFIFILPAVSPDGSGESRPDRSLAPAVANGRVEGSRENVAEFSPDSSIPANFEPYSALSDRRPETGKE